MSLFGGTRVIWIEPAGDEIAAGVEALLEAPAAESPVVAIAGALRKTSALLKLAEASPRARWRSRPTRPRARDAERMVIDVGRRYGLKLGAAGRRPDRRVSRQRPGDRRAGAAEARALPRRLAASAQGARP